MSPGHCPPARWTFSWEEAVIDVVPVAPLHTSRLVNLFYTTFHTSLAFEHTVESHVGTLHSIVHKRQPRRLGNRHLLGKPDARLVEPRVVLIIYTGEMQDSHPTIPCKQEKKREQLILRACVCVCV